MPFYSSPNLICPLCSGALLQEQQQLRCPSGHSFDIARQGYVNLLPVQFKKSKQPGDSKEMIDARSAFLDAGHYQRIADLLCNSLEAVIDEDACVLDAGCGEGYYLQRIAQHFSQTQRIGIDISKQAILAAARRDTASTLIVASNRALPLAPNSVDAIICMFGFPVLEEFKRVLKEGGKLLLLDPGEQHLLELRQLAYEQIKQKKQRDDSAVLNAGFELVHQQRMQQTIHLSADDIQRLMLMTPHLFRATAEGKQRVADLQHLQVSIDVLARVFSLRKAG